jgi:hypothetical protein
VAAEVDSYPEGISEQAKTQLQLLAEKYADLTAHADLLPQPLRGFVEFVKKEGGGYVAVYLKRIYVVDRVCYP